MDLSAPQLAIWTLFSTPGLGGIFKNRMAVMLLEWSSKVWRKLYSLDMSKMWINRSLEAEANKLQKKNGKNCFTVLIAGKRKKFWFCLLPPSEIFREIVTQTLKWTLACILGRVANSILHAWKSAKISRKKNTSGQKTNLRCSKCVATVWIFLSLTFYVKSILADLRRSKNCHLDHFSSSENWIFGNLWHFQVWNNQK